MIELNEQEREANFHSCLNFISRVLRDIGAYILAEYPQEWCIMEGFNGKNSLEKDENGRIIIRWSERPGKQAIDLELHSKGYKIYTCEYWRDEKLLDYFKDLKPELWFVHPREFDKLETIWSYFKIDGDSPGENYNRACPLSYTRHKHIEHEIDWYSKSKLIKILWCEFSGMDDLNSEAFRKRWLNPKITFRECSLDVWAWLNLTLVRHWVRMNIEKQPEVQKPPSESDANPLNGKPKIDLSSCWAAHLVWPESLESKLKVDASAGCDFDQLAEKWNSDPSIIKPPGKKFRGVQLKKKFENMT